MLSAREICKSYGKHVILDQIDLDLAPGECIGIVGAMAVERLHCCLFWPAQERQIMEPFVWMERMRILAEIHRYDQWPMFHRKIH